MNRAGEVVSFDSYEIEKILHKEEGWFCLGPKPEAGYRGYMRPDEVMDPLVGRPVSLREGWEDQDPKRLLVRLHDLLEALKIPGKEAAPYVYDYWYRLASDPLRINLVFHKADGRIELFDPSELES